MQQSSAGSVTQQKSSGTLEILILPHTSLKKSRYLTGVGQHIDVERVYLQKRHQNRPHDEPQEVSAQFSRHVLTSICMHCLKKSLTNAKTVTSVLPSHG